jgi:hypothetical protein
MAIGEASQREAPRKRVDYRASCAFFELIAEIATELTPHTTLRPSPTRGEFLKRSPFSALTRH